MAEIRIHEVRNGRGLLAFAQEIHADERDHDNQVRIRYVDDEDYVFVVPIPTKSWNEFVRMCQSFTLSD